MRNGCLNALVVLAILGLVACGLLLCFDHWENPTYHGKRLHTWVDQAIWDSDPVARRQAVDVLLEALPELHNWRRTYLLMRFCHPEKNGVEKVPLPKEVLPFLIEALRSGEGSAATYASIALIIGGAQDTVPILSAAVQNEQDAGARERLQRVLNNLTRQQEPRNPQDTP
jgi:hypothetical protein